MPRKNPNDYRYISFQIKKEFLEEIHKAMDYEGLTSRSQLIRHLLFCWLQEVKKSQEQDGE